MFDPELESFKTSVDLRAYAASHGYVLDRKESWRGSVVMRHANGDKIIIKRDSDNHYVYFSVRDEADHGTIIDFAQNRLRLNFGAVRKELRLQVGRRSEALPYPPLLPTTKDRMQVERKYARMLDAGHHAYLEIERKIPGEILRSDRFAGRVRTDARENAIFPHFDREGLCGFEIKGHGFTGFSSGGSKGLWLSRETPDDSRLIFCESAVDALSYANLFPNDRNRYASVGGQLSLQQGELMRAAAAGMPRGAKIVAATDADGTGEKLAENIRDAVGLTGRDDLIYVLHQPDGFKDWNDQLRNRPKRVIPSQPHVPFVA
jgi:hypothetical protein